MPGMARPTVPGFTRTGSHVIGPVDSDRPYSSDSGTPALRKNWSTSTGMGAAAVTAIRRSSSPSSCRAGRSDSASTRSYSAASSHGQRLAARAMLGDPRADLERLREHLGATGIGGEHGLHRAVDLLERARHTEEDLRSRLGEQRAEETDVGARRHLVRERDPAVVGGDALGDVRHREVRHDA